MTDSKGQYTVELAAYTPKAGEGRPRRYHGLGQDALVDAKPDVPSLWANFLRGQQINPDGSCLGWRPVGADGKAGDYVWLTYTQAVARARHIGAGLRHLGVEKGSTIGLFSINRPEWALTDQGCNGYGFISVPLYDTLGIEAINHILNQTEMSTIVASVQKAPTLFQSSINLAHVKRVIIMDNTVPDALREQATRANVQLLTFAELEDAGEKNPSEPSPGELDDVATIMYTSGTTGLPKGVMITSRNLLADAAGVDYLGSRGVCLHLGKDDTHISYLPLAHVMERMIVTYALGAGTAVGFYQGDPLKLLDDIAVLKPTFFASVPRLLNRIYAKITAAAEGGGGIKAMLFRMAVAGKTAGLRNGTLHHWLWDRLIFNKVKARLGGRVRGILTGSAPISPVALDFLRMAFICEVYEGYGQTESCAGSALTLNGDYEAGHVGVPVPCTDIKLVDVPEMNYTSQDKPFPRGEICYKGNSIFKGYFKDEEKTKEALDEDGWLHSGDIGMWDEKGRLRIIDRKKNIFKLAQGEYISPEKIENVYSRSKYVAQVFVHGESLKAYLVGIVIPDAETILPWCQENNLPAATLADAIQHEPVKKLILDDIVAMGKSNGLHSFEQVKIIELDSNLFSVENDLLTPSFKLRRPQAKDHYKEQIAAMYAKQDPIEEAKSRDK